MSDESKLRDYLKRVSAELATTRERLRATEDRAREPIAVVGAGCRFPGGRGARTPCGTSSPVGTDAVGSYPANRESIFRN